MFSKETYIRRRAELRRLMGSGLLVFFGNNDSPANYPNNTYVSRQDSSFLYYFGQKRTGLVGVIDIDNDEEWLFGDDIDIEDIVWMGAVENVCELAAQVGVAHSAPMKELKLMTDRALGLQREIHFLPPYRHDIMIQTMDLLGIHPSQQRERASLKLIKAVCQMRSVKEAQEIEQLERAADIGYLMHTTAMRLCKPGVTEQYIAGQLDGVARSYGAMVSFETILTQHGEIMHGVPTTAPLEKGRLMLCDAGAENNMHYCSDNTRTMPVGGKFSARQLEIYQIVEACHDLVLDIAKPGVRWWDVHFAVARLMTEKLKETGLMKGDVDEAVAAGAHAMFFPHGLGHMMGMDVHDMEGLGQQYIGFDEETQPNLTQFGTNSLRIGRRVEEGFVLTDEPGIYFIPALIDDWKKSGHCREFINFDLLETYKDFGGIRIEDDILITADGCRFIGQKRIPYHPEELEEFLRTDH